MPDISLDEQNDYRNRMVFWVLTIVVFGSIVLWGAMYYANEAFKRDVENWQIRLSIAADLRKDNIDRFLNKERSDIAAIAENASLRLYMADMLQPSAQKKVQQNVQVFLRNYIISSAAKHDYMPSGSGEIRANIRLTPKEGLFLVDKNMNVLVGTADETVFSHAIVEKVKRTALSAKKGQALLELSFHSEHGPLTVVSSPVFAVQGDSSEREDMLGYVIGIKPVGQSLYPLLSYPSAQERSAETYLLEWKKGQESFRFLSPIRDARLNEMLGVVMQKSAHGGVLLPDETPGSLSHQIEMGVDYQGTKVLFVRKEIQSMPWILVHKVNRSEALEGSDQRRLGVIAMVALIILMVSLLVFALWRHATSMRYQKLAREFNSQKRLLDLVASNVPDGLFIVDENHMVRFVNQKAAQARKKEVNDLTGQSVLKFMHASDVDVFQALSGSAKQEGQTVYNIQKTQEEDSLDVTKTISTSYIPLAQIPRVLTDKVVSGTLVVEHDITELVNEREKKEHTLKELVNVIVKLVDSRDSYTARHSERVAHLAQNIAREMALESSVIETVFIAGEIMNIGKILLPRKILTKEEKLTDEEQDLIQSSILKSALFVESIDFDGPVVETLRQSYERYDGQGVLGLKGDEILITARILHVANACVAMLSNRSYRTSIAYEDIVAIFTAHDEVRYDRQVVLAMITYLEKNPHMVRMLQGQ